MSNKNSTGGENEIHICLEVPDQKAFSEFIDNVEFDTLGIKVKSATQSPLLHEQVVTIDISGITKKQRQIVLRALELGYYQYPRKSNIGKLAEEFDITESAISQHLRTAECKLIQATFSRFQNE